MKKMKIINTETNTPIELQMGEKYKIRHYTGFMRNIVFKKIYKNGKITAITDNLFLEEYIPNSDNTHYFALINDIK